MALVGSVSGSSTYNSRIGITGSVVFAGADVDYGASFPTIGNDVAFYVSGSSGGKDSVTDRSVSVFGSDLVISGAIYPMSGTGKTAVTHDLGTGASLTQNTRGGSITFTMNAALGANQQGQYLNVTSSQLLETDVIVCSTSYAHMFAQPSAVFQSGSGAFQIQFFNWSGTTVPDDTTFTLNWTAL